MGGENMSVSRTFNCVTPDCGKQAAEFINAEVPRMMDNPVCSTVPITEYVKGASVTKALMIVCSGKKRDPCKEACSEIIKNLTLLTPSQKDIVGNNCQQRCNEQTDPSKTASCISENAKKGGCQPAVCWR